MIELFQKSALTNNAQRMPPEYEYIKNIYLREFLNLQDYYATRVYAVKNQHFLVRLLTHVDTPLSYDLDRFVEATRTRGPYLAKAFKMTSEIDRGQIHQGEFYGQGSREIILYIDDYFDIYYAERNWKRISAVNTIWHPKSDLGFMLGNGKISGNETGMCFITINLPMLALQLRCFMREQKIKAEFQSGSVLGLTHFVHMYVLPNMLFQHTDIVIANRLYNMFYDLDMGITRFKHAFPIVNYSNKLDSVLDKLIGDYYGRSMEYEWLLSAMPGFSQSNMLNSLMLPDIAPTRQAWWALYLSRLKIIELLVDFGGIASITRNRDLINKMKRDIKRLRQDSVMNDMFKGSSLLDIETRFDKLSNL